MNRRWAVFPRISAPMPFQMALDEVLFRGRLGAETLLNRPLLRFYQSSEPWVTTGFSDPEPLRADQKVCRRITGGGRVHHGQDLIFSVTARREEDESFRSVRLSYAKLHEAVRRAYASLGRETRFYQSEQDLPRGGECFRFPIASDLEYAGGKIAGGAQKRSLGVMLHQESLQLAGLEAVEMIAALRRAFSEVYEVVLADEPLDPALLAEAAALAKSKYDPAACAAGREEKERFLQAS